MSTILLTSAGMDVKDEILKVLPKPPNQIKLAHVTTASKVEEDPSYLDKEKRIMKETGFEIEDIDIEGKNTDDLRDLLRDKDAVYVQGGNTFYLLKQVRESGFDTVVKELIEQGVVYIGVSAGSCIACPTIEATVWKGADKNMVGLTDFTAMNLVPFLLFVHFEPEHTEIIRNAISDARYPVKVLTDDQAFLIQDGEIKLVGQGEEIKL